MNACLPQRCFCCCEHSHVLFRQKIADSMSANSSSPGLAVSMHVRLAAAVIATFCASALFFESKNTCAVGGNIAWKKAETVATAEVNSLGPCDCEALSAEIASLRRRVLQKVVLSEMVTENVVDNVGDGSRRQTATKFSSLVNAAGSKRKRSASSSSENEREETSSDLDNSPSFVSPPGKKRNSFRQYTTTAGLEAPWSISA